MIIWVGILFAFRFLSLKPVIIDDDEAWFSASAKALHHPFQFYTQTPDNKPPGTVWFYWLFHGDPQITRAALSVLIFLAALFLGRTVTKITRSSFGTKARVTWVTSGLILCISALFPKLFAVTNEGLILVLSSFMLGIWLLALQNKRPPHSGWAFFSGVLACAMILVKQTSLIYLVPVLYAVFQLKKERIQHAPRYSIIGFVFGLTVPLAVSIFLLGPKNFLFWNFIYTATVLTSARSGLFSESKELFFSLLIFSLGVWPCFFAVYKAISKKHGVSSSNSGRLSDKAVPVFVALWFLVALSAALSGWGLFLHYFIPLAAPLGIACGLAFEWVGFSSLVYVSSVYAVSALFLLIPYSSSLWGADLFYYEKLSQKIQALTTQDETIFMWGGNAIPFVLSDRKAQGKFLTTRFVAPPYSTPEMERAFQTWFKETPPTLFVDLHQRHDNRFKTDPLDVAWIRALLEKNYVRSSDPSLPWATFYRLSKGSEQRQEGPSEKESREYLSEYPEGLKTDELASILLHPSGWPQTLQLASQSDDLYRTWMSLELLTQSENPSAQTASQSQEAITLRTKLSDAIQSRVKTINDLIDGEANPSIPKLDENYSNQARLIFASHGFTEPLPLEGRAWWVSFALKTLQP